MFFRAQVEYLDDPGGTYGDACVGPWNRFDEQLVEHARSRNEVLGTHDLDFARMLSASSANKPGPIPEIRAADEHALRQVTSARLM